MIRLVSCGPHVTERESARRGRKWSWAAAGPRRAARAGEKEMGRVSARPVLFFSIPFLKYFITFVLQLQMNSNKNVNS
jgi:hypothetical protein